MQNGKTLESRNSNCEFCSCNAIKL